MPVNPIQVQNFLSGVEYPAAKDDLVAHARSQGAGDDIASALEQLPDRDFDSPADVSKAVSDLS